MKNLESPVFNPQSMNLKVSNPKTISPMLRELQKSLAHTLIDIEKTEIADASVLLVITNEAQPKLLLTRRASHMKSHAGEVAFAGGKHEKTDTTNIATALRESNEETNLDTNCLQIIGQLKPQTSKSGLTVKPIVAIMPPESSLTEPLIAEKSEIDHIFWVELEWLITAPTQEYLIMTEISGQEVEVDTPSWQAEGEIVWGLTGRIIANMLRVGFDRHVDWYYRLVTKD